VGNESTFKAQVAGVCPFCQKKFQAGKDGDGNSGIVHQLPICKQFEELDPPEYLRQVRLKYSS
jgi:hypothetical protein